MDITNIADGLEEKDGFFPEGLRKIKLFLKWASSQPFALFFFVGVGNLLFLPKGVGSFAGMSPLFGPTYLIAGWARERLYHLTLLRFYLDCQQALGMQSGAITDGQITASSQFDANHGAIHGRLYMKQDGGKVGAWVPRRIDLKQWLQVDLGNLVTKITGVATQGRNGYRWSQWVTMYRLQYSQDGVNFQYYKEQGQTRVKVSPL